MATRQPYKCLNMEVLSSTRRCSGRCACQLTLPADPWRGCSCMTGCPSGNALLLCYTGASSSGPLNSLWHVVGKHKTLPFTVEVWHHCRLKDVHLAHTALSRHHRADPTCLDPEQQNKYTSIRDTEKKSRPVSTAVVDPPIPLRCNIDPMKTCPVSLRKFGPFFVDPTILLLANNVTAEGHKGNGFK